MALTEHWTQLRYHPIQAELWRCKKKFAAVVAGRGSGKTELSRRRVIRYLPIRKPWPDPIYFYALPTRDQAKRVAWEPLKNLVPPHWVKSISETNLTIETVFGSTLFLLGLDKPARVEGVQWDGGVIDESSDIRPGTFDRTFMPTFSHRDSWCWRIGVPKRYGQGAREFKKFYESGIAGTDPDVASFHWKSAEIVSPEVIERAKRLLSDIDFAEQYGASWEQAGGLVFYSFRRSRNVARCSHCSDRTIYVGSDFNVNPMAWTLSHKDDNGRLWTFDEIWLRDTNTQATLDHLWKKYGEGHKGGWVFCGDASGKSRHSNAVATDYILIQKDQRFKPKRILYPKANPPQQDRFASTNALLYNAAGEVRAFIDPRCQHLLEDLENRVYKEGTREPNDVGDISHCSDAYGYSVHTLFPLRTTRTGTAAVHVQG